MPTEIRSIQTGGAPAAIGPYSQAIVVDNLVFTSGQIPVEPTSGKLVEARIETQARQVFKNLEAVLGAAGTTLQRAVKVTVYLTDLEDFQALNRVYAEVFGTARPARSTVQVARLPLDSLVEVDVVALR